MKPKTQSPEAIVREIKRNTRRKITAEEKIRIVLEGLKGEDSIAEICRREGIPPACTTNGAKVFWKQANGNSMVIRSVRQPVMMLVNCGRRTSS